MSEKKYIFKIEKGDPVTIDDGRKYYKLKLVGENFLGKIGQEITFNERYVAHYENVQDIGEGPDDYDEIYITFCCAIENVIGSVSTITRDATGERVGISIVQDENGKYHLKLAGSRMSDPNGKEMIFPDPSLKLHVNNLQLKEYYEEQSQRGTPVLYIDGHEQPAVRDLRGQIVCELHNTVLLVTNEMEPAIYGFCSQPILTAGNFKYVTVIKNEPDYSNPLIYFSDRKGNSIAEDDWNVQLKNVLQNSQSPFDVVFQSCDPVIIENLTDAQIENLVNHLTDHQLQILAEHLTDDRLQALVDHLTNHQLETLAQELNETKLKIIVPTLSEDQLGSLVRGLEPDQVKNLLPHLKMDQFKSLINNIDDHQLVELAKDLPDHHLTILSKELWHERLPILVHTLEENKLKDLVNKLDDRQLVAITQDLTDPSRIKVIIDSLIDPEKLQILAHNMSDEQFAKLLNELSPKDLKDIIHKLPYEKVVSVVGQQGNQDQFDAVIKAFQEKFREQAEQCDKQMAKQDEVIKILEQIKKDMPYFAYNQNFTAEDGDTYPYDLSILV